MNQNQNGNSTVLCTTNCRYCAVECPFFVHVPPDRVIDGIRYRHATLSEEQELLATRIARLNKLRELHTPDILIIREEEMVKDCAENVLYMLVSDTQEGYFPYPEYTPYP